MPIPEATRPTSCAASGTEEKDNAIPYSLCSQVEKAWRGARKAALGKAGQDRDKMLLRLGPIQSFRIRKWPDLDEMAREGEPQKTTLIWRAEPEPTAWLHR